MAKLERAEGLYDPDKCEASGSLGSCPYKKMPGSLYCKRHGGNLPTQSATRERERMYLLNKWQDRVDNLSNHPRLRDLTNELGIMRMMLEETLNQCNDAQDLIRHSARVTSIVDKIQRLVETLDKIEARNALQPAQLANLANQWVQIINIHVKDPMVLEKLSDDLLKTIEATVIEDASS